MPETTQSNHHRVHTGKCRQRDTSQPVAGVGSSFVHSFVRLVGVLVLGSSLRSLCRSVCPFVRRSVGPRRPAISAPSTSKFRSTVAWRRGRIKASCCSTPCSLCKHTSRSLTGKRAGACVCVRVCACVQCVRACTRVPYHGALRTSVRANPQNTFFVL